MEATERLASVREAIQAILLTGQSYSIGTRKLTRADLGLLRQMERDLKDEIASENAGAGLVENTGIARFGRR